MKKINTFLLFFYLTLIGCGIENESFTKKEIDILNANSNNLIQHLDSLKELKKNESIEIKNEAILDSIYIDNKVNFLNIIRSIFIQSDYISYYLNFNKGRTIQVDPYLYYKHIIIYSTAKNAGKVITTRTKNGKVMIENIFLIENGEVNKKWADKWNDVKIIYSEKLDENLYYIIEEHNGD